LLGLYWHRCNATGVLWGLACGTVVWFITLMIPMLVAAGMLPESLLSEGLFGVAWLSPEEFLGLTFSDHYARSVVISLTINLLAAFVVSSLDRTSLSDRIQAAAFVMRSRQKS